MTELKLSQSEKSTAEAIQRELRREDRRVFAAGGLATAVIIGLLITLLFEFGGCSRKRESTISTNQNSPNQMASSQPVAPATETLPSTATQRAKKPAKLQPSTLTYKDSAYGVSFRYPRRYTLKTGDQLNAKNAEAKSESLKSSEANSTDSAQPKGDGEKIESHSEVQNNSVPTNGGGVHSSNDLKPNGDSKLANQEAESPNVEVKQESETPRNIDTRNVETSSLGFVQPGGILLARVEMPTSSYRKTDFVGGFFGASVNRSLSAEQCEQFNFVSSEPAVQLGEAPLASPSEGQSSRLKTQIRGIEFTEMDRTMDEEPIATDAKYYHLFKNGACYEFTLGVQTDGSKGGVSPVDREAVFSRLEKILATVKIKPVVAPELQSNKPDSSAQQTASAKPLPKS